MNNKELMESLNSNSVTYIDDNGIVITYDLGDGDDAERFASKFNKLVNSEDFKELNIPEIELLEDESDEEFEWTVATTTIPIPNNLNIELVKKFLFEADSI